jgi:putative oxidoreductase
MNRNRAISASHLLLRVITGLLFAEAGSLSLFGWFGGMPPSGATAHPFTQIWVGAVLEVFGGILIALGLCTRPVAFILSGEMAVAYFQFHAPKAFFPVLNHGELAILMCFIYLFMAANGGGAWSLDALVFRAREPKVTEA